MTSIYINSENTPAVKIKILLTSNSIIRERKRLYAMLARYDFPCNIAEDVEISPIYPIDRLKADDVYNPLKIIVLLSDEAVAFNEQLTNDPFVRCRELLDSALNNPFQSFGGFDLYPSLYDKAARLCYGLIENHPFLDGNKRTATHSVLVFLKINGVKVTSSDDELYVQIMNLTKNLIDFRSLSDWLRYNSKLL